jgi:acetoin utilization deacetylase AcuC-like enzyme
MQQELVRIAARHCGNRLVFVLEGGYQLDVLSYGVLNAFYALLGDEKFEDPLGASPRRERSVESLIGKLRSLHGLA